jgi:phosphate starvation-inducible membrane PsiE
VQTAFFCGFYGHGFTNYYYASSGCYVPISVILTIMAMPIILMPLVVVVHRLPISVVLMAMVMLLVVMPLVVVVCKK